MKISLNKQKKAENTQNFVTKLILVADDMLLPKINKRVSFRMVFFSPLTFRPPFN